MDYIVYLPLEGSTELLMFFDNTWSCRRSQNKSVDRRINKLAMLTLLFVYFLLMMGHYMHIYSANTKWMLFYF